MQPTNEIIACILSPEKSQSTLQTVHENALECLKIVQAILERIEELEKEREHGYNRP